MVRLFVGTVAGVHTHHTNGLEGHTHTHPHTPRVGGNGQPSCIRREEFTTTVPHKASDWCMTLVWSVLVVSQSDFCSVM